MSLFFLWCSNSHGHRGVKWSEVQRSWWHDICISLSCAHDETRFDKQESIFYFRPLRGALPWAIIAYNFCASTVHLSSPLLHLLHLYWNRYPEHGAGLIATHSSYWHQAPKALAKSDSILRIFNKHVRKNVDVKGIWSSTVKAILCQRTRARHAPDNHLCTKYAFERYGAHRNERGTISLAVKNPEKSLTNPAMPNRILSHATWRATFTSRSFCFGPRTLCGCWFVARKCSWCHRDLLRPLSKLF